MKKKRISESALYQRLRREFAKRGLRLVNGKASGWIVLSKDDVVEIAKNLEKLGRKYGCLHQWEKMSDENSD